MSSGREDTSCKELKKRPINFPKSLSLGNNIFSNLFKLSTYFFNFVYSELLSLRFDERKASKDRLIWFTRTPKPD